MAKTEPRWIKPEEAQKRGIDDASVKVKERAKAQKISVTLSKQQMDSILAQWAKVNNAEPAEISFVVEDIAQARLRVAAYGYFTDTCCA